MQKISVLALYRSRIDNNRGTPIRIYSLLKDLGGHDDIDLRVYSKDEALVGVPQHTKLTGSVLADILMVVRYVHQQHIEVFIGHTITSWPFVLAVKFFTGAKTVLEMHGFLEEEMALNGKAGRLFKWFAKLKYSVVYRLCDSITMCNQDACQILKRYNKSVVKIYGGVNTTIFRPDAVPMRTPGEHRIIVGYAGNTRTWQGLDFLINVFAQLNKKYPDTFVLWLLTSGEMKHSVHVPLMTFPAVPHEQVPQFLASCHVLVIPRLRNPVNDSAFPSKLPEYMAMGKPVIGSKTSDMHHIIVHGVNGLLYEPGDETGLLECLEACRDEALRQRLGDAALKTVHSTLTWPIQADILYKHVKMLVN